MHLKQLLPLIKVISFCLLLLNLSFCNNPCEKLAKDVCDCEDTEVEQQNCFLRVDELVSRLGKPNDNEEGICADIRSNKTCTCEAINNENYLACGLSVEPAD